MGLVQGDAEVLGQQRGQSEGRLAGEARRDHRVGQPGDDEAEIPPQQPHVVVRAVEDLPQPRPRERLCQGRQLDVGERVHERVPLPRAQLDEADLLTVVVKRVGLGVERQGTGADAVDPAREGLGRVDPFPVHGRGTLSFW